VILILGLVAWLLVCRRALHDKHLPWAEFFAMYVLLGGIACAASVVLSMVLLRPMRRVLATRSIPIASLAPRDGFVLGSGTLADETVYVFLHDLGDGRYVRVVADATRTEVWEQDGEPPRYEHEVLGWPAWWILPWPLEDREVHQHLIVPVGTAQRVVP